MKSYIFNTNFSLDDEKNHNLITKQRLVMEKCDGNIIISSDKGLYNYNDNLQFEKPHTKSLFYGLYIELENEKTIVKRHFLKTTALFISTMWAAKDIYVVSNNGFYINGNYFNDFIKYDKDEFNLDLYQLGDIYLIYVKGDERDNVLLENVHVHYDSDKDLSILSVKPLVPEEIIKHIKAYTYSYSDSPFDTEMLNQSNKGYAIGNEFDISKFSDQVEHVNKYYFINKYIEMYM